MMGKSGGRIGAAIGQPLREAGSRLVKVVIRFVTELAIFTNPLRG